MKNSAATSKVVIAWIPNYDDSTVHGLAYAGGKALIRVFLKDEYDSRLDIGRCKKLPYFDDYDTALLWMIFNKASMCQIDLIVAVRMDGNKGFFSLMDVSTYIDQRVFMVGLNPVSADSSNDSPHRRSITITMGEDV